MDNNEAYSILRFPEEGNAVIVYNRISGIKVRVIEISKVAPEFKDTEMHFFGECKGSPLAFETIDYNDQGIDLITDAIRWYAEYCGEADMKIRNVEFDL